MPNRPPAPGPRPSSTPCHDRGRLELDIQCQTAAIFIGFRGLHRLSKREPPVGGGAGPVDVEVPVATAEACLAARSGLVPDSVIRLATANGPPGGQAASGGKGPAKPHAVPPPLAIAVGRPRWSSCAKRWWSSCPRRAFDAVAFAADERDKADIGAVPRMNAMPTDDDALRAGAIRADGHRLFPAHLLKVEPSAARSPDEAHPAVIWRIRPAAQSASAQGRRRFPCRDGSKSMPRAGATRAPGHAARRLSR